MRDLLEIIEQFEPISLEELDAVRLLNRIDIKYIFPYSELPKLLKEIQDSLRILEIDQKRMFTYETNYYDTEDFKFYKDHHNGCINRVKVRTREYTDSGLKFYEVKRKMRGTRTDKIRRPLNVLPDFLSDEDYEMIDYKRYTGEELKLRIGNRFQRITLTNKILTERITIDTQIELWNAKDKVKLPGLVVMEVKQGKTDNFSKTILALKKLAIRPCGFSKYSIGVALLEKNIKKNNFKPTLLKLNKIAHAG